MIEAGLYVAAGFLAALLLVMIVAPAVWRRAVFLTRKRIESSVPLTVAELQADKDRLRAEHAVEHNRLESSLEQQRAANTQQAAELSDLGETLKVRDETIATLNAQVDGLNASIGDLQEAVGTSEAALASARLEMETTNVTLSARAAELETIKHLRSDAERQLAAARETLDDHSREMASIEARLGDAREKLRAEQAEVRKVRAAAKQTTELLKTERAKTAELDAAHERLISERSDLEEKLARREAKITRLGDARAGKEADLAELEQRAADAEADRAEMERELGAMTVRLAQIDKAMDGKSLEAVLAGREARQAQLQTDLKIERRRVKALEDKLAKAETKPTGAGDAELREEIATLAAEIVYMAALLEGDRSPIPGLIATEDSESAPNSLATRVRALQERAKQSVLAEPAGGGDHDKAIKAGQTGALPN